MDLEEIKSRINPQYQDVRGTESYERKWLCDEIDRLRKELADSHAETDSVVYARDKAYEEIALLQDELRSRMWQLEQHLLEK